MFQEKIYILFDLFKFFLAKIFTVYQNDIVLMARDKICRIEANHSFLKWRPE